MKLVIQIRFTPTHYMYYWRNLNRHVSYGWCDPEFYKKHKVERQLQITQTISL